MAMLFAVMLLSNSAYAGEAYCDACSGDSGWSGSSKLDEIGNTNAGSSEVMPGLSTAQKNRVGIWGQSLAAFSGSSESEGSDADSSANDSASNDSASTAESERIAPKRPALENETIVRSAGAREMLLSIDEAPQDALYLDISELESGDESADRIPGSIAIPYTEFLNGSDMRGAEEMAEILGEAGISRNDSVVIYGECMPCGGGPAPATFIYWILSSLGQEDVRVLDGTVEDWALTGRETTTETAVLPATVYTPEITSDYAADYDYVLSGSAQLVDARSIQEFGAGSIPGSINIPNENVVADNRIRDESRLLRIFSILDQETPVVVFTNTGLKGSVVWFALSMMGYDAQLYSYENYLYNQAVHEDSASGAASPSNSTQ